MPKKKRDSKPTSVRVRNMSDISGNVIFGAGNITMHHITTSWNAAELKQLLIVV
jgi:hypothetical protein